MKIAISGASGFIGSHLAGYLTAQGHQVVPLGRGYFSGFPAPGPGVIGDRAWDGAMGRLVAALEGCGAVVNLAGAPIDRRWSDTYKEELYASRIGPTRRLVEAIGALETPPGVLVSASAVGYYPAEGCYKETDARKGTGFLSDLCAAWEQEAQRVPPGVRLVVTRFGVVFSPGGGAFPRLARPFRMGVAARLGDGSQNVSWIALEDLVRAIGFVLEDAAGRRAGLDRAGDLRRGRAGSAVGPVCGARKVDSGRFYVRCREYRTVSGTVGTVRKVIRTFFVAVVFGSVCDGILVLKEMLKIKIMSGCCCGCNRRKVSVEPMENFDVNRYLGRWHEIARLDHRFERGLERITATYTLRPDGKVGVVNRGYDPAKKRWSDAKAYAVQTRVKNYLKVYFFPLVPGRYRIAYLDDDYSLAVVSGGSLRYLWLLSRTPEVTPQQRARMLGVARGLGYDTSKLIWPEPDEPSGD